MVTTQRKGEINRANLRLRDSAKHAISPRSVDHCAAVTFVRRFLRLHRDEQVFSQALGRPSQQNPLHAL
jgi:hypothetical protein